MLVYDENACYLFWNYQIFWDIIAILKEQLAPQTKTILSHYLLTLIAPSQ